MNCNCIYIYLGTPTWREARDQDLSNTLHTGSINIQNKQTKQIYSYIQTEWSCGNGVQKRGFILSTFHRTQWWNRCIGTAL